MPRRHSVIAYPFEVLAHLLWSYIVWTFVSSIVLPLPFVVAAIASGQSPVEAWRPWMSMFPASPGFFLGSAHVMVCVSFAIYFAPRFPDAPKLLTFALAALLGSAFLALVWNASSLTDGPTFATWLDGHRTKLFESFLWAVAISLAAGLFGAFIHRVAGGGSALFGVGKWLGWLIVGRATFDDFVERETARLRHEYDEYANARRGHK